MNNQKENCGTCAHYKPDNLSGAMGHCLAKPIVRIEADKDLMEFRMTVRGRPACNLYEPITKIEGVDHERN